MAFKKGTQVCNTSQSCHKFDLSHTHACTCEECHQVRNTNKTEKNVRATKCSVFTTTLLIEFTSTFMRKDSVLITVSYFFSSILNFTT